MGLFAQNHKLYIGYNHILLKFILYPKKCLSFCLMNYIKGSLTMCRTNGAQSSFNIQQEIATVHERISVQQAYCN